MKPSFDAKLLVDSWFNTSCMLLNKTEDLYKNLSIIEVIKSFLKILKKEHAHPLRCRLLPVNLVLAFL